MRNLIRAVAMLSLAAAFSLAGCTSAQFQAGLAKVNVFATTYGPVIGKDIIMVANILVQAECSPALAPGSQAAANVLNIVAPNSSSASRVVSALQANQAVAAQLCPLYASIKASIGAVPANAVPSQVVNIAPPATPVALPTGS